MLNILLTSFNRPGFVARALASLLRQSCRDWHCIVLDDNSDPETLDTICMFEDPRITVIAHTTNDFLRAETTRYSCLINEILPGLRDGIVGYLCDNVEYGAELVATVLDFFAQHPEAYAGYVLHERDVWSADMRQRLCSCGELGHWDILPAEPGALIGSIFGRVDHSQVFHRLPCGLRWNESPSVRRCGDGEFFTRLVEQHGPLYRITDQVLTHEHLIEGRI